MKAAPANKTKEDNKFGVGKVEKNEIGGGAEDNGIGGEKGELRRERIQWWSGDEVITLLEFQ